MTRILLDAGHGGGNSSRRGFVNVEDYMYCNEGQNNYYFATLLKKELEVLGHTVAMTRDNMNEDPSLASRGKKGVGYDFLLSVHSNGGGGQGVEVWDSTNPRESDEILGDKLCKITADTLGIFNRGTKYKKNNSGSNFYGILRNGQAKKNMILEMFFHDNYNDTVKFINNHIKLSKELARVISEHFGVIPAPSKPNGKELTKDNFIEVISNELAGTKTDILKSVTIAQAILESNWGQSYLSKYAKNLFGIKASSDWQGAYIEAKTKEQDKAGNETTILAKFRKYDSYKDSILDHDKFFTSTPWRVKNYKRVLEATDYIQQATALQMCGYATDTKYAAKLINLIEQHKLQRFDEVKEMDNNKVSDWAKELWQEAIELKITDGTRPKDNVTREEAITMILRAIKSK